ncbi:formin homology 2 domain containing protein, putative [Babesia ovis]|uniref:Formin homology 2 domain containing protein, putative n=1 Tax=Babesia ovis TaxID=5869 RepID=A0A9W5T9M2_BABOV|nr:formin homology 2 domain containing protein, putative [Babesia ovis]
MRRPRDNAPDTQLPSSGDVTLPGDITFTDAVSSSRMVSSLLKSHERNIEASRSFPVSKQDQTDSMIQSLDFLHVDTNVHPKATLSDNPAVTDWGGLSRGNIVRRGTNLDPNVRRLSLRGFGNRHFVQSGTSTPSDVDSAASSDMEVNAGMLCRKNALGMIFRNRGKTVQRAKEKIRFPSGMESLDSNSSFVTPQRSNTGIQSGTHGSQRSDNVSQSPVDTSTTVPTDEATDATKSPASAKTHTDLSPSTSADGNKSNLEQLFMKIKRAVSHDLSDEIRPPLIHSFTNKIFAIRTPWQLPMKERSLRNNVQQLLSFFRVLERYVEDQVFKYGPALHPRLERIYNELYVNVGHIFKKVSDSHISQLDEPRRLAVVGNGVYDLGDHRPRGAPIYYQKFVIFDLSLDNASIAAEHGDLFHRQVLHFPMNSRGLPSMGYLCSVASAVLFWLDFYNRDNVVVFNYASLNYNMLLTFACSILASQPMATANEIDQLILASFDWRRNCRTVPSKTNREKLDPTKPNDMPQMIPIARWPPSYKRYMSYFLSLYVTPIDFVLAQQFRLKRVSLVNCLLPGTEVMLEVYHVGPAASQASSTRRWANATRRAQCSRYAAAFYPKCVCGGNDRDDVTLIACSSDYQLLSRSTSSKSSKYGYVGEVIFDFKMDAEGNRHNIVIAGDVCIVLVAVSMKQRKVIASYSFNTGFVSSESLEVPKAEFDIWDTSCAIQPQGQMTISMESRQRHNTDAWNIPNTPIVITPPMSDVGVFMKHHVAKVSSSEIQALAKNTGLSSDTCEFALKLCPRFLDAMAMLNALFIPQNARLDGSNVASGNLSGQSDLLTVESVDTLKGVDDGLVPSALSRGISAELERSDTIKRTETITSADIDDSIKHTETITLADKDDSIKRTETITSTDNDITIKRTETITSTDKDNTIKRTDTGISSDRTDSTTSTTHLGLTIDMVEKLLVDNEGAMQLLLKNGSTKPVPQNSITSLFQMLGVYQGHLTGSVLKDPSHKLLETLDGTIPKQPGEPCPSTTPKSPPPGTTTPVTKQPSPPPKSPSAPSPSPGTSTPVTKKAPPAPGVTSTVSKKAPPPPPGGASAVTKKAPPPPPSKMKAPPPPTGLKRSLSRTPPPLGIKLHWKPLNVNTVKGTIFENLPSSSVETRMFDTTVAKQLFSKAAVKRQQALKAPEVKRKLMMTILDPKRAQNVGIILRFPKESDFQDLLDSIDRMDLSDPLINIDNLFKIQSALPQGNELDQFQAALDSGANISAYRDIEQKIFNIIQRKYMEQKVTVAHFQLHYQQSLTLIHKQLDVFERANKQINTNEMLPIMMGGILQYGNFVNHGEDTSAKTVGFSLSSASKLIDLKSADNAMSSMHYLMANLIVKYPHMDFGSFDKSLNHVLDAEKISATGIDEIFDEVRDGLNSLLRMETKLQLVTSNANSGISSDAQDSTGDNTTSASYLLSKTKAIITTGTESIGTATDRRDGIFESTRTTWRYLGEECKQGSSLEEIFRILADFMRCIKRTVSDIQQKPSKYIVALNIDEEREIFQSKFFRSRRH